MTCLCSKSLKFFRTSKIGLNSDYFAKIAHKIAKSKYFPNILNDSDSPIDFRRYIICWGNVSFSKIIGGGGHPAPPHPFILQNCVIYKGFAQYVLFSRTFRDGPFKEEPMKTL